MDGGTPRDGAYRIVEWTNAWDEPEYVLEYYVEARNKWMDYRYFKDKDEAIREAKAHVRARSFVLSQHIVWQE